MNEIKVLLFSKNSLESEYQVPPCARITNISDSKHWPENWEGLNPDLVLIHRDISYAEANRLSLIAAAYRVFYTDKCTNITGHGDMVARKVARKLEDVQYFLTYQLRNFYDYSYGEKFRLKAIAIAQGFKGRVNWIGDVAVELEGEYGEDFNQIAYWRGNIPLTEDVALDIWLEYEAEPGVEVCLKITQFVAGSISDIQKTWEFSQDELKDIMEISNDAKGPLFFSLSAKGEGKLKIIALHDRHSRQGFGAFIPGGERYTTSRGEELFAYFDPGDLKPPLNIFFSGYKTKQGFEGYNIMRRMGKPFLLIAEPRLEGGAFYMGTPEYERMVVDTIRKYMERLGFSNQDVIMAGISMGTFGATYYGCDIRPRTIILGKPLFSIGSVAQNERLIRPGGFPTSVDVLLYLQKDTSEEAAEELNERFWTKFNRTDWRNTEFVISYMYEDDYDTDAYEKLISNFGTDGVTVYGKGLHGRHNDNTSGIVEWFISQYEKYAGVKPKKKAAKSQEDEKKKNKNRKVKA